MNKKEFDLYIHTPEFFEKLSKMFNNNKSMMAHHLDISRPSLYKWMMQSRMIKMENDNNTPNVNLISFDNLVDYLKNAPGENRNDYLLGQISGDRKPLRSNTLLIVEAIRAMLRRYHTNA